MLINVSCFLAQHLTFIFHFVILTISSKFQKKSCTLFGLIYFKSIQFQVRLFLNLAKVFTRVGSSIWDIVGVFGFVVYLDIIWSEEVQW